METKLDGDEGRWGFGFDEREGREEKPGIEKKKKIRNMASAQMNTEYEICRLGTEKKCDNVRY